LEERVAGLEPLHKPLATVFHPSWKKLVAQIYGSYMTDPYYESAEDDSTGKEFFMP
jgi:hypothetical protein